MQPVPPVYQPEVAAEAIYSVIQRPVNELWVGKSTIQSILGQVFFPRLLDRLMVKKSVGGTVYRPAEVGRASGRPVHAGTRQSPRTRPL
ncbi:hypothetical protein [Klebsiella pneumoniae]|uniref:hypothetical protein n=1 Tax=Klebsiella pneumoniae TaxID=573 RepID=UPI003EE47671